MSTKLSLFRGFLPISGGDGRHPARLGGPIRGVLLDMCNVLYDATLWRRWVLQLLTRLGLHTSYRSFFKIWDRDYLDAVHRGQREFCEAFEAFLASAGLSRAQIDEVEGACQARRRILQEGARPLPGVKTTLGRLHKSGFVLGAISNSESPASVLQQQLGRFGLDRLFTTVISSFDLKQTMPEEICYRTALESMNYPPAQVAFVDHDTAELAGATAVGMPTVAFNFDADARADAYLDRFDDLLEVVGEPRPLAAAG
ncbi:MAG TPA: HAD-IA family hydrolase [Thermoguttaceae bacterium]|nr:HAD-IA family hydrolase [Thermoguttaceae bacterium]